MMRSDLIDIREAHRLNEERYANIYKVASRPYHPVCANTEREHFLGGAATPPNLGGEFGKPRLQRSVALPAFFM